MKRRCRILVLFVLTGVFGGLVVPPVDLPETSFDESAAPATLALPLPAGFTIARPARDPSLARVPSYCAGCVVGSLMLQPAAMPRQGRLHSIHDLLCTFLI